MIDQTIANRKIDSNDEVIDLTKLFYYLLQGAKRFWAIGVAIVGLLLFTGYIYAKVTYVPQYKTSASLIVTDSMAIEQTSSDLTLTAQMGKTFSYILKSDMLRNVVKRELGTQDLSAAISVQVVANTNLLTISVTDADAQHAYDVLNAVLENYPTVSDYILGATKIEIVQQPQIPTTPFNGSSAIETALKFGAGGVVVCLLFLLCYAFTRKTVSRASDLQDKMNVTLLASIPFVQTKKRSGKNGKTILLTQKNVNTAFEEAFRKIANRMEQKTEDSGGKKKVYVVTSSTVGEGKTTIATNLALTLAKKSKKVLLIDADLRRASSTIALDMQQSKNDLGTFLSQKSSWNDSIHTYKNSMLYVLPTGKILDSRDVSKILSKRNIELVLEQARKEFDYIIVDTPPMGLLADAANVVSSGDEVIVAVRQDQSQMNEVLDTFEQILERNPRLFGFVMNHEEGRFPGYQYGKYGYGSYGYAYGQS